MSVGGLQVVDTVRIADYFSRVLRRGQLEKVTFSPDTTHLAVPRPQLDTGSLADDDVKTLFDAHRRSHPKERQDKDAPLPVVISLVSLSVGSGRQRGLLLLAAQLFRDGHLEAELEAGSSPWIPADRLKTPNVAELELMVGELRAFGKYSRSELGADLSRTASFTDAVNLSAHLFEMVSGQTVERFAASHGRRGAVEYGLCYIQEMDRFNVVGPLLDVYDYLKHQKAAPALVNRICQGWTGQRTPGSSIHDGNGLLVAASRSCGSMGDEHPLTPSQRLAVHAFLTGDEITAVSGPPGTGKTTMLQAIVASLVTSRALNEEDPPVIVGTSTNNQAVTNIIDSFAKVAKDEHGPLDFRWLPAEKDGSAAEEPMRSLAVYCPSGGKLEDARKKYLVEQTNRSETYTAYSGEEYISGATDRFVMNADRFLGGMTDVPHLQRVIHEALKEVDRFRTDLIAAMAKRGNSHRYRSLFKRVDTSQFLGRIPGVAGLKDCQTLEDLDLKLDTTLRYAEFWLAVHYFEATWLTSEYIDPDERWKRDPDVSGRYWRQAAALTPCFVMTAYQVPKYFQFWTKPDEPTSFDEGRIDLLIVDEAGQVDTPVGLPALALAKRALVVGDEKQLAPVWSIDEETDREVAEDAGSRPQTWKASLQPRGLTCSATSSLMRAASHASRWSYGQGLPGLFLSEHFRCHPDIISFCNELLYDGLLEPRRDPGSSKLDGLTPAFVFKEVPGSQDSQRGSSRINEVEAKEIAAWIVGNYPRYFDLYNSSESDPNKKVKSSDIIGVVTPFRAQADLIMTELKKAATVPDAPADLPDRLWNQITVGTAHSLQGAERQIILFSAAYGESSARSGFIDATPELMNVAVSRAKDLLIVFAAANRWGNGPVFSVISHFAERISPEPRPTASVPVDVEAPAPGEVEHQATTSSPQAPSTPDLPVPTEEQATSTSGPIASPGRALNATSLLKSWQGAGDLRAEDEHLNAAAFNLRLKEAGILDGKPGSWQPSRLAEVLGVVVEEKTDGKGEAYSSLTFTPQMQKLMLSLYHDGQL